jgi:glutathione S-transferase
MKLYEFAPTRSIRVRWTLQELGVPFESVTVNMMAGEHKSPAFLKINPAGKLPVLVDGDLTLTESIAISLYRGEIPGERFRPPRPGSTRGTLSMAPVRRDGAGAAAMAHRAQHRSLSREQTRAR